MNKPLLWQDADLDPHPIDSFVKSYRHITCIRTESELRHTLPAATVVILYVSYEKLSDKQVTVTNNRRLPILWFCNEKRIPREPEWGYSLDGMIFPGMDQHEIDWAIQWATRSFLERKRWHEEKEQLMQRLEERKWVDQAKAILCEIKGITESEAYDFLRKQAMNERKRTGEVAASIVKVYQLIHG